MGRAEVLLVDSPILTGAQRSDVSYRHARPNGSDDWLLFCTTAGRGTFRHGPDTVTVGPGDLTLYHPRHAQDYGTDPGVGSWAFIWAHVRARPEWTPWLAWPSCLSGLGRLHIGDQVAFSAISARFLEVHRLATSARHHRHELALNALEEVLLRCDEHNAASPAHRDGSLDPRLRTAIDHCLRDLGAAWDVGNLARVAGMSPSRFAHLFRGQLGESPRRFIERHRIARAGQLLRATAMPVSAVAHEVGYPDPFHFSLRFRAVTGRSPSRFRGVVRKRKSPGP